MTIYHETCITLGITFLRESIMIIERFVRHNFCWIFISRHNDESIQYACLNWVRWLSICSLDRWRNWQHVCMFLCIYAGGKFHFIPFSKNPVFWEYTQVHTGSIWFPEIDASVLPRIFKLIVYEFLFLSIRKFVSIIQTP